MKEEQIMNELVSLAESMYKSFYQEEAPEWEVLDTPLGVISQIDNMYAGIREELLSLKNEPLVERFIRLVKEMIDEDIEEALSIVGGAFISMNEAFVEAGGHDPNRAINISTGEGNRDVTIHADGWKHGDDHHWTDKHIKWNEETEKWDAFDEAGLLHGKFNTKDEARDALVVYSAIHLNGGK